MSPTLIVLKPWALTALWAWALMSGHSMAIGQTTSNGRAVRPPAAERCLLPAAQRHGVNPKILKAILQVESGMRADVVNHNRNGTMDVGMAQINSIHFPELAQWGITPSQLMDPCVATHVAAWHLKRSLLRHGNTWFGVAAYHSATPEHNLRYQELVRREMARTGSLR
jgi:soluble lytic murein transglycosylase-like protein